MKNQKDYPPLQVPVVVGPFGNVSATAAFGGDNLALKSDGTGRKIQATCVKIDDDAYVTPEIMSSRPAVHVGRTATDNSRTFFDGTKIVGDGLDANSYDTQLIMDANGGTMPHGAPYQSRFVVRNGTVTNMYGYSTAIVAESGGTIVSLRNYFVGNGTGAGSVVTQYGVNAESLTKGTFNYSFVFNGEADTPDGTQATQAIQTSLHQPNISFGSNTTSSNNYQVDIYPTSSTVSGRGAIRVSGGTLTGSSANNTVDISQTWNTSGTVAGFKLNITNTASNAASKLLQLQTGGTDMFSVSMLGTIALSTTNTAGGTTGAQTINKPSGTVNFAAAATSLVVTNSVVTTASKVFCVVRTNDTTAVIKNVVPGSGSFTITLSAAATSETSVGFFVIN